MNLEKKTYKNYKELCVAMEWQVASGNTKIAQLKDLERFCTYHKQGNKFVIDEVLECPLTKQENKRHNIYGEDLDKLILHMCVASDADEYKHIELSKNALLTSLCLVNSNYRVGRNNINKFSQYMQIPVETLFDFYNSSSKKLVDILEGGLSRLKSKCLIDWYHITTICINNSYRRAKDHELELIKQTEHEVLQELGFESKREVFLKGKWNEFQNTVNKLLFKAKGIDYYFTSYRIITTKTFRNMIEEEKQLYINEENKEIAELNLNSNFKESCINTAEKTHVKYVKLHKEKEEEINKKWLIGKRKKEEIFKYDSEWNRYSDKYVVDVGRIVDIVVDTMEKDFRLHEALEKVEKTEKYTYIYDSSEFYREMHDGGYDKCIFGSNDDAIPF
ncbi:hypothetical protein JHL18_00680 [Clostridium sp. YIM B02505]|uniref:Uncharacterized protein n=1 Tax=Clostridium yunnanense TaxID=2800325 RepID=A0ABS1EII5_9CLOT|nr:hypothetical protein [Clostridium yunnanense]MBK1809163.1 hypothetical protein [Clostridium yunnanense]